MSVYSGIYLRDLLYELVSRDIKLRYKGSVLGIIWSLLNPLAQLLVFSIVFRWILPLDIPNYTAFLFSGLLVWSWFQSSLFAGATAIVDGRYLIKRPGFPTAILPIITVVSNLVHFLLALPILLVFLVLTDTPLTIHLFVLPVVIGLQFIFTLSLIYWLATAHVMFRDTQYLIGVFLLLLFYLTPIFYNAEVIPKRFEFYYRLNPVLHLLNAYRAILLDGELPNFWPMVKVGLISAVLLFVGYHVFMRTSYRFVEEL